jgi:hypothetical protein
MVGVLPTTCPTAGGYHSEPIKLCGGMGDGEPEFSEKQINFNGDGEHGLDHETFRIVFDSPEWDFCKTARKPYDMVVCLCLISMKNNIPDGFEYSSDGDLDDWQPAYEFYEEHIGPVNFKLEKYEGD